MGKKENTTASRKGKVIKGTGPFTMAEGQGSDAAVEASPWKEESGEHKPSSQTQSASPRISRPRSTQK